MIKRLFTWLIVISAITLMVWVMVTASKKGRADVPSGNLNYAVNVNDWALLKDKAGVRAISGAELSDYLNRLPKSILGGKDVALNGSSTGTTTANGSVLSKEGEKINSPRSVVIVEYSDFQCPACGTYHPIIKKLLSELSGEALFVYRHFPLSTIHPNAEKAAIASEAVALQGGAEAFWAMHDTLFEKQDAWSNMPNPVIAFKEYVVANNLNPIKFEKDMTDQSLRKKVVDSYKEGVQEGIMGTPTIYINGKQIVNPASYENLKTMVESNY